MVLKEYLVALGFKIDDASYAKFMGAAAKTASGVALIATEAIAAATAIGIFTERVARNFNDLYYAAQRNSTTVAGLQQVGYAFSQVGRSADDGRNAVMAFGRAMLDYSGKSRLQMAGITTTDAADAIIEYTDYLRKTLGPNNWPIYRDIMTGTFNQNEEDARAQWLNNDKIRAQRDDKRQREKTAGFSQNTMAEDSRGFIDQVNKLLDNLTILKDRMAQDLIGPASKVVAGLDYLVVSFTVISKTLSDAIIKGEGLLGLYRDWKNKPVEAGKGVVGTVGGFGQDMLLNLSRVLRKISDWRDASEEKKVGAPDNVLFSWPTGVKNIFPGTGSGGLPSSDKRPDKVLGMSDVISYPGQELRSGGDKSLTINQRNEIKIEAGPNASETADRFKNVFNEQPWSKITRDMKGPVQ